MRNAFQTGAKIYLSEKNILWIRALEVQNLGKDEEGKYSETLTKIQVTAVFFLTEKTKNFSSAQKVAQNEKSCSKYKMLPKNCRNQEARGI